MEPLEVGDRVRFIDDKGGMFNGAVPPLGSEANITARYALDGEIFIDVKWDYPTNGHAWIEQGFLAERFHKLYRTSGGEYSDTPPLDPWDPRRWF